MCTGGFIECNEGDLAAEGLVEESDPIIGTMSYMFDELLLLNMTCSYDFLEDCAQHEACTEQSASSRSLGIHVAQCHAQASSTHGAKLP